MACVRGRGICAHHKKATARQRLKVPAHERAKPPLDAVPGDRRANRPADHESYPGRFPPVQRVVLDQQVAHHQGRPARVPVRTVSANSAPRRIRDWDGRIRHSAGRGPCACGRRGWRARPGCACAAGNHASSRGADYSAGTCAYSLVLQVGIRLRARSMKACGSRIHLRLPSGTLPFARRAPLPGLRLWKASVPMLPQSGYAAGMSHAQHVDWFVDRERGSRRGDARGAPRWQIQTWQKSGHDPSMGWPTCRSSRISGPG